MAGAELVTITDGAVSARINPLGAELWSLTDSDGREYMTNADPAFWAGHAPLLFPIVGALNGGRYRLEGREYALPKHGFARTRLFDVVRRGERHVRFRLSSCNETREVYPFDFRLDVDFAVLTPTLAITVAVYNGGSEPMPFSFGFHPAFAWPLPDGGSKDLHRVIFAHDEPQPIRRMDTATATLLPQPQPSPVVGNVLHPEAAMFEDDALIWDRLNSRSVTFAGDGPAIDIAFPDCPNLGIWQKPGAPFLAIEPWHGFNDPQGFQGDFRDKPGIVELPCGEARSFRMDVTVRPR